MYKTRAHTVYEWLRRYKSQGFLGLKIVSGRGLKARMDDLSEPQIDDIRTEVKRNPQGLREVSAVLSEKFGFEVTKSMLKKYLKKTQIYMAQTPEMAQTPTKPHRICSTR
jgi:transposase